MTNINVAKSSGFCSGVRRAIDISLKLSGENRKIYILGDIVHNSFVVSHLESKGIKKIKKLSARKGATLIIRAHGAPKSLFAKARAMGYRVVDATCPKVKEIYRIARRLEKKQKLIIIGDHDHDEVKGIAGQLKGKPIIIESVKDIGRARLVGIKKAGVVTQSTQSAENITRVMEELSKIIPEIELYDTTCRITKVKQQEIKALAGNNDMVFVVGSRTSANTGRLYEIAKNINKNTFRIESAVNVRLPKGYIPRNIGVMAGASTPDEITREIVARIEGLLRERRKK
jgi:4-hydroxy-3-methylbut-2-en-1-yl diphosphate reductase